MFKKILRRLTSKIASTPPSPSTTIKPAKLPFAPRPRPRFSPRMPMPKAPVPGSDRPKLSLIVIIYNMPDQAEKTLASLAVDYQRNVRTEDYEVLVMENNSGNNLGQERAIKHGSNFRYYLRHETEPTPIHAINFAVQESRADFIGIIIDGARMLTPGVVSYTIAALAIAEQPVICVPGYHLGAKLQQEAMQEGYDETHEQMLLDSIQWPSDGYRLFEISCFSGTSSGGYFKPLSESNCLCMSKQLYAEIGGCDKRFNETGGGQVNLDLYKRASERDNTTLIALIGEGSFHQFHGGITTGQMGEERIDTMRRHFAQYASIRGEAYIPPDKRPILFGAIADSTVPFIMNSANNAFHALQNEAP
ncbi:MAG: glycosyltransferase family A protein [Ketobacter sp.]|uniref:glycosyltransferase n=1 Tax=Ketobacter sp. MCCC 1A13808 TaxID=2602738 RepID=UPI0018DC6171|nr:glycosyltransferase family A protein [Ketobacter sp. MCCC 1A13808]